jgi:membrane-bound lytic murein transglycosylase D
MKKIIFVLLTMLSMQFCLAQRSYPRYQTESQENVSAYKPIYISAPETPRNYTLFGERMPLEQWDVRERLDREILVNTYMQGSTAYIIKQMGRWLPMIEARLRANNIPDDFKYLCIAESALQNQTSRVGAVGFWQFMPATAPIYGLHIDGEVDERYNPEKSTDAACKYLKEAYNKFGNWTSAAASYNCGMGGMNGALTNQGETSFYNVLLPEETMRYVFRIAALKYILDNQKMFGYNLNDEMIYHPLELRSETISSGIGSLVSYAKSRGTNYKTIRMLNPWMRDKFLNNSKGRTYTILLPRN